MSDPVIELRRVTKRFADKVAVRSVSFTVLAGQCYGLIGPNGAGKTTTFSMMCGYLFPTEGQIRVLGQDPEVPGSLKGRVGVLPQDALLPPNWKVGGLLTYWARLSGLDNPEREAREALHRVALSDSWGAPAGTLSHGMAKRVAMAQALMGAPPVVFLDEPTSGLDPKIAAQIRQLIREMKGRQTIVVSSHNLQELEELCDATAILDRGELVAAASIAEMTSQTAEFRVQVARGNVPLVQVRELPGCQSAELDPTGSLTVRYEGGAVAPEEMITRTVRLLIDHEVLILGVTRGHKLEDKVLQLT